MHYLRDNSGYEYELGEQLQNFEATYVTGPHLQVLRGTAVTPISQPAHFNFH